MQHSFLQALESGERARVNQAIKEAVDTRAPLVKASRAMIQAAERNGEIGLALAVLDAVEQQAGVSVSTRLERAAILNRAGQRTQALALVDALGPSEPDPFLHAYLSGTMAASIGQFDRARAALTRALELQPLSGQAWFALSTLGDLSEDDVSRLLAVEFQIAGTDPAERGAYYHTVGRARHRLQDYRGAFEAFEQSAQAMRQLRRFDPKARSAAIASLTAGWDRSTLDRFRQDIPASGPAPLFVTGLPRSGTTLTEQVLVSHSAVTEGAEVELFPILFRESGSASVASLEAYAKREGSLAPLRSLYQHLLAQRFPQLDGRFLDKSVLASPHLGLIAALFPESPIVWVRRDPVDNAWSAFSSFFLRGLNWSWSFSDIADVFSTEDELLALWQDILGDQLMVLDYAELATSPEPTIRALDAFCGLPFEPSQLHPEKVERTVTTASLAQVREPINTKGLGTSAPYRERMGEFLSRYRPA